MKRVVSHRRVEADETGQKVLVENAVEAENILNAGDLTEAAQVSVAGEALLVGVDGTLRRTTLAAILQWLQENIQSDISFNVPYVDEETKVWMRYNPTTGQYENSGVVGEGKSAYQYAVAGGYAGSEEEYTELMEKLTQMAQEDGKYRIEIPGKNGNGSSVVLWNSGDGRLRIKMEANGQACEMVLSADAESGFVSIFGVHTGDEDDCVATRGFVENAIQEAITGAIEGGY